MTSHWTWPAEGVVTDIYGTRNGHHKGIDIAGEYKTPIYTVDKGVVTKSYYSGTYGHVVFVKHENNMETVYAHLHKRLVSEGQRVNLGDKIGEMGNTGDSSGVHLHFEIHNQQWTYGKENAINPLIALGEAEVGQTVTALERPAAVDSLETIAKLRMTDDYHIEHPQSGFAKAIPPAKGEQMIHTVKKGETLWSIAQKYKTSVEEITSVNETNHHNISAGDTLVIKTVPDTNYVVSAGDTLHSIAEKTNTTVQELKDLNHLISDVIQPQQILITR
ncbi:MAG TPA: hypothetical protein DCR24_04965 [Bacillus bacterium]|nr:hypothetical protein [Bacillus sp. (in: firmicutes)]